MDFIRLLFSTFLRSFTNMFFLFLVLIVYWNIKKTAQLEQNWLGFTRFAISDQLLDRIFYGMISGFFASFLIVLLGITIDYKAILLIWPVAIFLMLFNQRYMCFSYAAGIISLISLVFKWPQIDVSAIIALVGILHLIESVLILVNGHKSSLPVYIERDRFNPEGAHVMQKVWPIPLVVLVIPDITSQLSGSAIDMPNWWPIFKSQNVGNMLAILPIVAILGYADIAITQAPKDRAKQSGLWLTFYSIIVLGLAIISSRIYWVKYLAAISAPLLHEFMIVMGQRSQTREEPLFNVPWKGVRILSVFPGGIGEILGLKQGDIILAINGRSVNSIKGIEEILSEELSYIWLDINRDNEETTLEGHNYQEGISDLGAMFIPRQTGKYFLMEERRGLIPRWLNRRFKKRDMDLD